MSKYANLVCGIKVLANDENSFNVNEKGYNFIQLLRKNVSRLPKKSDLEEVGCLGVMTNIEKLYGALVKYNSTVNPTKAQKKASLENIIRLEEVICDTLGLNLREENNEVYKTETVTINQYDFFNACFAIKHASKKERLENNNIVDVVTLTSFKKAVVFGLCEACVNDGELYKINGRKAKTLARIDKKVETKKSEKKAKAEETVKTDEEKLAELVAKLGAENIAAMVALQNKVSSVAN